MRRRPRLITAFLEATFFVAKMTLYYAGLSSSYVAIMLLQELFPSFAVICESNGAA
jgi:hypothetical protein